MTAPSPEEIQRVQRWQCNQRGTHEWEFLYALESDIPTTMWCAHCGISCTVIENDPS